MITEKVSLLLLHKLSPATPPTCRQNDEPFLHSVDTTTPHGPRVSQDTVGACLEQRAVEAF